MFWGDAIVDDFLEEFAVHAGKRRLVLRDEKTLSGKPHVGSLRSFVMHATLSDILTERGIDNVFYYEINDTDAFDHVPDYVPANWKEHLGKRLKDVPSPDGKAENYADFFGKEYTDLLLDAKYRVEFYKNSAKYESGAYDEYIRLALLHKDAIRTIYKEVSGSEKPEDWFPCQVICDGCGKIATTSILSFDGKEATYVCDRDCGYVSGCSHRGKKSPFSGNATLPWKVEWAAKFCATKVDLEGAGKDHYAAGGSRHVSNAICEKVFGRSHPFDVRHEFILVSGAKMSSSSGVGTTAADIYKILPRYIFRFMMIQKDVMKTINFSPDGDTIAVLFDQYDEVLHDYFEGKEGEVHDHKRRIFELTHFYDTDRSALHRFTPRFSQVAFYLQIPHIDIERKFEEVKGSPLSHHDLIELRTRGEYAARWLATYCPEKYIFKVQDHIPESASSLGSNQKAFLGVLSDFLSSHPDASGEIIQGFIHEQKEKLALSPSDIFRSVYFSLLGKESGPKAGWLLEALENGFLVSRFREVAES